MKKFKASHEEQLNNVHAAAQNQGLCTEMVSDLGKKNRLVGTALAFGPAPKSIIDKVTVSLKPP